MTQLLVQGEVILAQGPLSVNDNEIRSSDAIYPAHVVPGWQIVDAVLPDGFSCGGYTWNGRGVDAKPIPVIQKTREQLKAERQAQVDAITVTVNGKLFDGDETSQARMARALRVADITGQTSCIWVLHDNTAVSVTKDELSQALALSMQAQGAIWVI